MNKLDTANARIAYLEEALKEIAHCKFCGQTHAQRVAQAALRKRPAKNRGGKP